MHTRVVIGILIFVVVVATALSAGTFILFEQHLTQTHQIEHALNRANFSIIESRQAAYRICLRQMVNRAVIDNTIDKDSDDKIKRLPLFNCKPDLIGMPAIRMTPAQAMAFRALVKHTPEDKLP